MRSVLSYSIALIVSVFLLGASHASAAVTQRSITVSATAEVQAKPDTARITFGVTTENVDAKLAAEENAYISNKVISALTQFGIPKEDISTVNYSVNPRMDYQKSPPVTLGYTVSNQVLVKLKDITKTGTLIDTGVKAGANNVQGVGFEIEDETTVRSQALTKAIKLARAKAQTMASALGVHLDQAISASESGGYIPRPMLMEKTLSASDASPTPIIPGELTISAGVTVVFAIR